MKRYYLIPILDESIYFNGKLLRSIMKESYPDLVEKETERIDILYSVSPLYDMPEHLRMKYIKHIAEMEQFADEIGIPYYLIAYGNDRHAKEIITRAKIKPEYPAALGIRSVTSKKANDYYMNCDYEEKILSFTENYKAKEKVYIR